MLVDGTEHLGFALSCLAEVVLHLIRGPTIALLLFICAVALVARPADAQRPLIPREHHAWGRFSPGSWTQVRKLTEEFDEQGKLKSTSTTETKTTLIEASERSYALQLEVTVEVVGKRIVAQPRTVRLGYYGEMNGQRVVVRRIGDGGLLVGGRKVQCQILESTINGGDEKTVSTIHYCPSAAPFVLKRDMKSTDIESATTHLHTQEDVIAIDMPHRVMAEVKTAAHVRKIKRHAKGSIHMLEIHCSDVPGGVVSHASKELDGAGRLIRRSTLELLDYGAVEKKRLFGRGGILRRGRPHKPSVRVAPPR